MSLVPVLIALEAIHEGRFIDESPVDLQDGGATCAVVSLTLVFLSLTVWWSYRTRPVRRDAWIGVGLGFVTPIIWSGLEAPSWIILAYLPVPVATMVVLLQQIFEEQVASDKVQRHLMGADGVTGDERALKESYYLNYRWIQVVAGVNLLHVLLWPLIYPMDTEGWDRRWPLICQNLIMVQAIVFGIAYLYVLGRRDEAAATACAALAVLVPVGISTAVPSPALVASCLLPGLLCALVARMYVLGKRGGRPPGINGPEGGR